MKLRNIEIAAVALTVGIMVGMPALIFAFDEDRAAAGGGRVIALTAVGRDGVWTDQDVSATNFAYSHYRAATLELREDERVTLRLTSADVTHSFYAPDLGIGPVEVESGKVKEVVIEHAAPGVYTYYCTKVCGVCHHFMRGTIVVSDRDGVRPKGEDYVAPLGCEARDVAGDPSVPTELRAGERVFRERGCINCHGEGGRGGVPNFNYLKPSVPALEPLAERMMLFDEDDAKVAIELILSGADLEVAGQGDELPLARYGAFLAQYKSVYELIQNGNPAGKKDPNGLEPPLHMPRWKDVLSDREIRSVIAYVISRHDFDADDDDEGDDDDDDE